MILILYSKDNRIEGSLLAFEGRVWWEGPVSAPVSTGGTGSMGGKYLCIKNRYGDREKWRYCSLERGDV